MEGEGGSVADGSRSQVAVGNRAGRQSLQHCAQLQQEVKQQGFSQFRQVNYVLPRGFVSTRANQTTNKQKKTSELKFFFIAAFLLILLQSLLYF